MRPSNHPEPDMSDVKRYRLMYFDYEGMGCIDNPDPFAKLKDQETETVVIASDHDAAISALASRLAEAERLINELRDDLINIVVGGCTCGTKPPDPQFHELSCHYRMAETGLARIAALSPRHQSAEGAEGEGA